MQNEESHVGEAARKTDSYVCPNGGIGVIQEGSMNVTICGQAAARSGDKILHEDGSTHCVSNTRSCLLINGKPAV